MLKGVVGLNSAWFPIYAKSAKKAIGNHLIRINFPRKHSQANPPVSASLEIEYHKQFVCIYFNYKYTVIGTSQWRDLWPIISSFCFAWYRAYCTAFKVRNLSELGIFFLRHLNTSRREMLLAISYFDWMIQISSFPTKSCLLYTATLFYPNGNHVQDFTKWWNRSALDGGLTLVHVSTCKYFGKTFWCILESRWW